MSNLAEARAILEQMKFQEHLHYPSLTRELERLAGTFANATPEHYEETLAHFHDIAGRLPYAADSDFGALVLEAAADSIQDAKPAQRLYREAFYRARWCVQGGLGRRGSSSPSTRLPEDRGQAEKVEAGFSTRLSWKADAYLLPGLVTGIAARSAGSLSAS